MAADARAVNLMPIGRDTIIEGLFEAAAIELDELGRRDSLDVIRRNLWQQVGGGHGRTVEVEGCVAIRCLSSVCH